MKSIIVVEGRDDTRRLREVFPDIQTIETNGSAINQETLAVIEKAVKHTDVIVLTDPDYPGEKIRQTITKAVPNVQHAFLTVEEALPKGKGSLGVEHADDVALRRALSHIRVVDYTTEEAEQITQPFLVRLSLVGGQHSKVFREQLSKRLGIGHVNGKQLEKRLNMFGITKDTVLETLGQIVEEMNETD